jgi:hypothetical protein
MTALAIDLSKSTIQLGYKLAVPKTDEYRRLPVQERMCFLRKLLNLPHYAYSIWNTPEVKAIMEIVAEENKVADMAKQLQKDIRNGIPPDISRALTDNIYGQAVHKMMTDTLVQSKNPPKRRSSRINPRKRRNR